VELADGKAYQHKGKLNFAASTVDGNTGTVQMRAELPNPKQQLLPGQYVRVRMVAGSQQAIVVPQTAVMQNDSGRFVWVAGSDGKAVQRNIRAGGWLGEDWVVLDGLKAGEAVIVDNVARLRPGTPVQVKKAG
jgi:membrane fusion protein (multidrug efflux system)